MTITHSSRALRSGVVGLVALALLAAAGLCADVKKKTVPLPIKLPKPAFQGTPKEIPEGCEDVEPLPVKPRAIPQVAAGTVNCALKKPVTASSKPFSGELNLVTDGDKEVHDGSALEIKPKLQWVQIDLGKECELSYVVAWHFHGEPVIFHSVVVQLSNDASFEKGVTTIYNNDKKNVAGFGAGKDKEYWETYEGRQINAKGTKARYVRLYSRGSTYGDPLNRYTEVEAYGVPAAK